MQSSVSFEVRPLCVAVVMPFQQKLLPHRYKFNLCPHDIPWLSSNIS